jgi:hypothetical protein
MDSYDLDFVRSKDMEEKLSKPKIIIIIDSVDYEAFIDN